MVQINNLVISGNLTADPEIVQTKSDTAVTRFTIANNESYGEKKTTTFLPVTVFGKAAENCAKYLKKGTFVACVGKLRQDRWEKDGVPRSAIAMTANSVQFGSKPQSQAPEPSEPATESTDDLPF